MAYHRALAIKPNYPDAYNSLGHALQARGDNEQAAGAYRSAIELNPEMAEAHANLGNMLIKQQKYRDAAAAYHLATKLARDPRLVHYCLAGEIEANIKNPGGAVPAPASDCTDCSDFSVADANSFATQALVSIIICSIDEKKFTRVTANFRQLLGGEPFEIIGIHDAKSLCEGYNRGIRKASGSILVFSHDDIEILSPDFRFKLRRYLKQYDLIGLAGATRLTGSSWVGAGWPEIHGQVTQYDEKTDVFKVNIYGIHARHVPNVQAIDGLFLALNRNVLESVSFDERIFNGFHFYDMDFTFAAHLAGFKLGICNDIVAVHYSTGNYDEAYVRYGKRFLDKYRGVLTPAPAVPPAYYVAELDTKYEVLTFCNRLLRLMAPEC